MYKNIQMKMKLHMLLLAIVFIGAINWGATAIGYNLVDLLSNTLNKTFNSNLPINNVIYIIGGPVAPGHRPSLPCNVVLTL